MGQEASKELVVVRFTKFDGGKMVGCEGTLVEVLPDFILVRVQDGEGVHNVSFRRVPGAKSGYGVGPSKFWRLAEPERRQYCHPDIPRSRR